MAFSYLQGYQVGDSKSSHTFSLPGTTYLLFNYALTLTMLVWEGSLGLNIGLPQTTNSLYYRKEAGYQCTHKCDLPAVLQALGAGSLSPLVIFASTKYHAWHMEGGKPMFIE